jgi:hypothetical protein
MIQIPSDNSSELNKQIDLMSSEPVSDFETARSMAKKKSQELFRETMLLAWHNALTGKYYPEFECGSTDDRPGWLVYAESRGANLTIRFNGGVYTFMFLGF